MASAETADGTGMVSAETTDSTSMASAGIQQYQDHKDVTPSTNNI